MHITTTTTARRDTSPPEHTPSGQHQAHCEIAHAARPHPLQALPARAGRWATARWSCERLRLLLLGGCRSNTAGPLSACKDSRRFKHKAPGTGVIAQIALYAPLCSTISSTSKSNAHDVRRGVLVMRERIVPEAWTTTWVSAPDVKTIYHPITTFCHCQSLQTECKRKSPPRTLDWRPASDRQPYCCMSRPPLGPYIN
jgi:hypothetical protein